MATETPFKEIKKFEKDLEESLVFFKSYLLHPLKSLEAVPTQWEWSVILLVVNGLAAVMVLISCLLAAHSLFNTVLQVLLFPVVLTLFQFGAAFAFKVIFDHLLDREISIKSFFMVISVCNLPFIFLKAVSGWEFPVEYVGLLITGYQLSRGLQVNLKIPERLTKKVSWVAFAIICSLWVTTFLNRSKTELMYDKIASPQDVRTLEKDIQHHSLTGHD